MSAGLILTTALLPMLTARLKLTVPLACNEQSQLVQCPIKQVLLLLLLMLMLMLMLMVMIYDGSKMR